MCNRLILTAAYQRMRAEPKRRQQNLAHTHQFIVRNHLLFSNIAHLAALIKPGAAPASPLLAAVADSIVQKLHGLSKKLYIQRCRFPSQCQISRGMMRPLKEQKKGCSRPAYSRSINSQTISAKLWLRCCLYKPLHRQFVALHAKAENASHGFSGYMGQLPEIFTGMHIGNMHFHNTGFYGGDGIAQSDRRMGVPAGVDYNAVVIEPNALHFIDQFAFNVALKITEMNMRKFLLQFRQVFFKRHIAVNVGFAPAEQVQVGSVDDGNFHLTKLKYIAIACAIR
jgi:hypothetical protein